MKLPIVSGVKVVVVLQKSGFETKRQKSSHVSMVRTEPEFRALTVPMHKEIKAGTLRSIIRDAGLSVDEFCALL